VIADRNIDTVLSLNRASLHSRVRAGISILLDLIFSINCPHVLTESIPEGFPKYAQAYERKLSRDDSCDVT
jgi:hypothetical protein